MMGISVWLFKLHFLCKNQLYQNNEPQIGLKINGLQVNGGGVFDRDFTKSLIIRDFDDVLKNPFRYVHLFL